MAKHIQPGAQGHKNIQHDLNLRVYPPHFLAESALREHCVHAAGWSLYKNVVILWDDDYDTRVLYLIDDYLADCPMPLQELHAIHERKGFITVFTEYALTAEQLGLFDRLFEGSGCVANVLLEDLK